MKTFFCACRRLVARWWALRRNKRTGATAARIGAQGVVAVELAPTGFVTVAGELWAAQAVRGCLAPGASVVVVGVQGVRLQVAPPQAYPLVSAV
ncbi:MAG: hypothetical protein NZ585_11780 [Chloracidobacterium sp.]|nr:hypothetical protein [Chloracidobacterium sp.]MDW8218251.1 NfeD family protein [Acidobacteriota bacterium]